jgi:hypothetical protein
MFYEFEGQYTPGRCQAFPSYLWVFGDNLQRVGTGGQAIIRPEPNAIGIATKRSPGAYMESGCATDMEAIARDCWAIERLHQIGRKIVLPILKGSRKTSLGCGLADLPGRAPDLYAFLCAWHERVVRS